MIKEIAVPYSDEGVELEGFCAYSDEKKPLVLLCHAWRGQDDFIREKTRLVASLGYVGFAIDMYGKGVLGHSMAENQALKKPFIEDRLFLKRRIVKGFNTACELPFVDSSQTAAIGFGFGAVCALDLARSGVSLKGAVSFYGHFDNPTPIKGKVLILHGYNDPIVPMSELHAFQEELNKGGVDWQTHLYSNTFHAFANPSVNVPEAGLMYNPLSANRAWRETENFLSALFP